MLIPIFAFTLFFALRVVPWKRKTGPLDVLILINLAYLATVYARNPVGLWAFQSQMVGGRPYFETLMALGAFIILSRAQLTPFIARVFPLFYLIPVGLLAGLEVVARLVPQFGSQITGIYSGVAGAGPAALEFEPESQLGQTRFTSMKELVIVGVLALCARHNPLKLISPFHPLLLTLLLGSFVAIFLSGYRSAFLFAVMALLLSTALRDRLRDVWFGLGVMVLAIVVLVSVQGTLVELPKTVQRTLSWLPGDWSNEAKTEADASSEWRFQMVAWAWNDNRIIKDKIWGQGFGFTIDVMNIIASALVSGQQGGMFIGGSDRENFMLMGSFHNGPVSAIRYVGVVGSLLFYPLLFYMAVVAWRLCRRARNTAAFPLALFVGIPVIYEPFNFIFIFGAYEGSIPQTLFWAGLLNLTSNYLDKIAPRPAVASGPNIATGRPTLPLPRRSAVVARK
jgi:hypothetical protein